MKAKVKDEIYSTYKHLPMQKGKWYDCQLTHYKENLFSWVRITDLCMEVDRDQLEFKKDV